MKNYQKKTFKTLLLCSLGFGAMAQVKVGSNPTTIDANANLQVQATNGSQVIVTKDNGNLGVGTINPTSKLEVAGSTLNKDVSSDFVLSKFESKGGIVTQIGSSSPTSSFGAGAFIGTSSNNQVNFLVGNVPVTRLFGQSFEPNGSNNVQLGSDANRWNTVYSGGGGMDAKNVSANFVASRFESQGGVVTQIGSSSPTSAFGPGAFIGTTSNNAVNFLVNNIPVTRLFGSSFEPNGSNLVQLGSDLNRWNTVYTGGGGVDAKNVSSDYVASRFESQGGVVTQIGSSSPTSAFGSGAFIGTASNHGLNFLVGNVPVTKLFGQSFEPNGSNLVQLGSDLNRWNTVYSGGGGFNAKNASALYVVSSSECQGGVVSTAGVSAPTSAFGAAAIFGSFSNHQVLINANNAPVIRVLPNYLEPVFNNSVSLGSFTQRYTAVYADNGTIQTSDRRLKENIKPIAHGLSDVMKIEAVSYDWKNKSNEKTKLGFIAQDLQKILPELIGGKESEDTYLAVNYAELTPVLVKAIQEQQAMIDALKLENNSLKTAVNQIEKLKEEMASIKNQMSNTQARGLGK